VESRAAYARREAENQSALLDEARRQANEAARAFDEAQYAPTPFKCGCCQF
jgi:hypothetical protein